MCTVAELIAKLQTLPQDAIVEVREEYSNDIKRLHHLNQ
jgi:hypothetical protein